MSDYTYVSTCYLCGIECNESSQICGRCARNGRPFTYNIYDSWYNYIYFLNEHSNTDVCIKNNNNANILVKNLINDLIKDNININSFYMNLYTNNIVSYMLISPEYRLNWNI